MAHHPVHRAYTEPLKVPVSQQGLKGLDGGESLFLLEGIDQGFDLDDGGEIPYKHPART